MTGDDRKGVTPPPSEAPAETADALAPPAAASPPALAAPRALAEALRYLQQRIPGFTHLSWQEKRSHGRAANLDPEFLEAGLHAAVVWEDTEFYVKRTGEELREEQEEIRRWDQVVVELRAITDGIEGANIQRKHRLGSAILLIYGILGEVLQRSSGHHYMRPYYDNMKRAFLRTRAFRRKTKKKGEP